MHLKFYLMIGLTFITSLLYLSLDITISQSKRQVSSKNEFICGYESCPKGNPNVLNIHLVAHSHDDVGWLQTVDQYYYENVQYIYDSVVNSLAGDTTKKFIFVETAFFWKWLLEQHNERKLVVQNLISNGQLEIAGGAWSMNDEAAAHYHSIIDQFTWGLRRLNDSFGQCAQPKIGWQIDPFGHSREMASLFAQMGFDGLFFGRIDYQDKINRGLNQTLEMIWKASENLGDKASIFAGVLYNLYQPPPGLCFDILCGNVAINDNPESLGYNVKRKVQKLLAYANEQAKAYQTKNIMLTMGGDFTYQDADFFFKSLDKIIKYIKENHNSVEIYYSTPSCYLKALHESNMTWPSKSDDFFPYASDSHSYWTGYYTSRPSQKYLERRGNNLLQVTKQLSVVTDFNSVNSSDEKKGLVALREAMGVMQHHDAISGTEKQHVAYDYARILSSAMSQSAEIAIDSINKILTSKTQNNPPPKLALEQCTNLNASECSISEISNQFIVVLYNPSSRNSTRFARIPVTSSSYAVFDATNNEQILSQIVPIPHIVLSLPDRNSTAENELVFSAPLPPLGFKTFYILKSNSAPLEQQQKNQEQKLEMFQNENFNSIDLRHISSFYCGFVGTNTDGETRSSGAYIFRPKGDVNDLTLMYDGTIQGPLVNQHYYSHEDFISLTVREYKGFDHLELDWVVGPIPIKGKCEGKEIVFRYETNLISNDSFYTDSNGREMIRRVLNYRNTWNANIQEPVSGNYYPVTSRIAIEEPKTTKRFVVLTDRSEGGSSLYEGSIELMVHRRLFNDDSFGVDEALNEKSSNKQGLVVRGTHYLLVGHKNEGVLLKEKELAQNVLLAPWYFFAAAENLSLKTFHSLYQTQLSSLRAPKTFPSNLQVLTLEPWKKGLVLFRIEHVFEKNEHPTLSSRACINIQYLFSTFDVVSMEETMLAANQWKKDNQRLKWRERKIIRINEKSVNYNDSTNVACDGPFDVQLNPMEIRTFILAIKSII